MTNQVLTYKNTKKFMQEHVMAEIYFADTATS